MELGQQVRTLHDWLQRTEKDSSMRVQWITACITMVVILCSCIGFAADFRVSESGHYFIWQQRPLLMIGDSGTQCVLQNLNIDYRRWIDDCAERDIRAIHVWSFLAPRQIASEERVTPAARRLGLSAPSLEERYGYFYPGATPWPRRSSGPLAVDGFPQYDLTAFDEGTDPDQHYWPRLRDLCNYARSRGIVVGISVFFGWPKHNTEQRPDWAFHPFNALNGGPVVDTGNPITECQRIQWPGREILDLPWNEDWPQAAKVQWIWERFAGRLIEETKPFGNVFFAFMDEHSYSEGNCGDHFAEFFRRRGALWGDWNRRRENVDFVYGKSKGDMYADAQKQFRQTPPRPWLMLEGEPYVGEAVRAAIWSCATGGGHYFFHDDERQETVRTGIMGYDPHVEGGDRGMVRRDWLGYASRFFNQRLQHLDAMVPNDDLVIEGDAYCLAAPGREYAVYSSTGDRFSLDLRHLAGRSVIATFYNPETGEARESATLQSGDTEVFIKPDTSDWALHLQVGAD